MAGPARPGGLSPGWMSRLHSRGYRSVSERFPEPGATAHPAAAANPIEETRRKAVEDLGSDHACATRGALNLLIAVVLLTITPETPGRSLERIEADAEARHS